MNYKLTGWLKPSIEEASHILNQRDALIFILKSATISGQPKDIKSDLDKT